MAVVRDEEYAVVVEHERRRRSPARTCSPPTRSDADRLVQLELARTP